MDDKWAIGIDVAVNLGEYMRYLFFDIECCDGNNICSLGYVLTNEKLEIITKRDILINPEKKFKLGRANFNPAVDLAYGEDEFLANDNFDKQYDFIKSLLTAPNQIILGHSVSSDLIYLDTAYKRYNKKRVKINAYDTQRIFTDNFAPDRQYSLSDIIKTFNIDTSRLVLHKSCDDAELTMLALKAMCKQKNITVKEMLRNSSGCIVNYRIIEENNNIHIIKSKIKQFKKKYGTKNDAPAIYFSNTVRFNNIKSRIRLIENIYRHGYAVTFDISLSKYVVCKCDINNYEKILLANIENGSPQIIFIEKLEEMRNRN